MLARKSVLKLNGLEVGTTPMLVPAVSSRTNLPMEKLFDTISQVVNGPLLISAYDYYHLMKRSIALNEIVTFPDLILLDSGGYECNKDQDVADIGLYKPDAHNWTVDMYKEVIGGWKIQIPTVLISFDHPTIRCSVKEQIKSANELFRGMDGFLKEILIKPEKEDSYRVNINNVLEHLDSLKSFDILGFTEKELGYSVFKRMISIAEIRKGMIKKDMQMPIHIFGSLDTTTTPLYYLAGADIFDGLSWLRFAFVEGKTLYIDSCGPKLYSALENYHNIWIQCVYKNYNYMRELTLAMETFHKQQNFNIFGPNAAFIKKTYEDFIVKIGGD